MARDGRIGLGVILGLSLGCLTGCIPGWSSRTTVTPGPNPDSVFATPSGEGEGKDPKQKKIAYNLALANAKLSQTDHIPDPQQQMVMRDEARQIFQMILTLDAKNKEAHQGLARVSLKMGNPDQAAEIYQKILKTYPKDVQLWNDLAMCHNCRKDWNQAIQCLKKAQELEPENQLTAKTLGFTLARAGRFEESYQILSRTYGPALGHFWVGRMQLHLNQPEPAREHLAQALQINPRLTQAQEMLASLERGENPTAVAAAASTPPAGSPYPGIPTGGPAHGDPPTGISPTAADSVQQVDFRFKQE